MLNDEKKSEKELKMKKKRKRKQKRKRMTFIEFLKNFKTEKRYQHYKLN